MQQEFITLTQFLAMIGEPLYSPWRTVDQEDINTFANATSDHQWIHTDTERAKREAPFGGTIAHGFLSLSLLSPLAFDTLPKIETTTHAMNYGFDTIRFLSPVKCNAKIRARFELIGVEVRVSGRVLKHYKAVLEVEGSRQPALTAQWIILAIIDPDTIEESGKFGCCAHLHL